MFTENLPIEYYGIASCDYPFQTVTERIITLPNSINIKNIIKVHSSIDLAFNSQCTFFNDVHYCICNITFNIEYIDLAKDNTISIFSDYIYAPLKYLVNSNYPPNSLNPKINHLHLNLLASTSIYIYLAICPY